MKMKIEQYQHEVGKENHYLKKPSTDVTFYGNN